MLHRRNNHCNCTLWACKKAKPRSSYGRRPVRGDGRFFGRLAVLVSHGRVWQVGPVSETRRRRVRSHLSRTERCLLASTSIAWTENRSKHFAEFLPIAICVRALPSWAALSVWIAERSCQNFALISMATTITWILDEIRTIWRRTLLYVRYLDHRWSIFPKKPCSPRLAAHLVSDCFSIREDAPIIADI